MNDLVRYDAMVRAIDECHRIDEVCDIRDQAISLEHYARMARNTEAERKACEIRLRAERRAGEMLGRLGKSRGGDPSVAAASLAGASQYRDSLQRAGLTERQAQSYQELARVPQAQFESALAASMVTMPSRAAILARNKPTDAPRLMPDEALALWGRIGDFERQRLIDLDPRSILARMTPAMRDDLRRIVPVLRLFLEELDEANHE
jgi:hypothetical protein